MGARVGGSQWMTHAPPWLTARHSHDFVAGCSAWWTVPVVFTTCRPASGGNRRERYIPITCANTGHHTPEAHDSAAPSPITSSTHLWILVIQPTHRERDGTTSLMKTIQQTRHCAPCLPLHTHFPPPPPRCLVAQRRPTPHHPTPPHPNRPSPPTNPPAAPSSPRARPTPPPRVSAPPHPPQEGCAHRKLTWAGPGRRRPRGSPRQ